MSTARAECVSARHGNEIHARLRGGAHGFQIHPAAGFNLRATGDEF
jgi:hypothetical protein